MKCDKNFETKVSKIVEKAKDAIDEELQKISLHSSGYFHVRQNGTLSFHASKDEYSVCVSHSASKSCDHCRILAKLNIEEIARKTREAYEDYQDNYAQEHGEMTENEYIETTDFDDDIQQVVDEFEQNLRYQLKAEEIKREYSDE